MKNDELQALLAYWRRILRLQDWNLTAKFVRHWDMEGAGRCKSWDKLKLVQISILDPVDHQPDTDWDIEQTLVHELMHVHFATVHNDWTGAILVLYEQAIEQTATALVRLNRGER